MTPELANLDERNNAMGAVEQWDILRDPPERLVAYIGKRIEGSVRHELTTWTGHQIGTVYLGSGWRIFSYIAPRMFQAYAYIKGSVYTGRTLGEGMCISLRETAETKRKKESK